MTGFCPSFNPLRCGSSIFRFCQSPLVAEELAGDIEDVFGEVEAVDDVVDNEEGELLEGSVVVELVEVFNDLAVNVSGLAEVYLELLT